MTPDALAVSVLPGELAPQWRAHVQQQLHPQENVLASLEVDLDTRLRFVRGLVLVTNRRLLSQAEPGAAWQSWDLQAGQRLLHHDHAGVGHLDFQDADGQLACLLYTSPSPRD